MATKKSYFVSDDKSITTTKPSIVSHGHPDYNADTAGSESCGYGTCQPKCLQPAASAKVLLACLCCFVFVQGFLVNGINNVNTTSLERRFNLRSAQVAWVSSAYDLSAGFWSIVLGYLGIFVHKGRLLAVTAGIMAVGGFVMFLPHLLAGQYQLGTKTTDSCQVYDNMTRCTDDATIESSSYIYLLITGMVLIGVGGSCVYVVGTPWIDESIDTQNTPIYLGIMHAMAAIGPAVAFVCGGALLNIYVDVTRVDLEQLDISPDDPRWVGAWWIGYLISAAGSLIACLLLACFPSKLNASGRQNEARVSQAYKGVGDKEMKGPNFGRSCTDVGTSLKVVLSNPVWICITLAGILESGAVMAFNTFLPKMLQFQFGMTSGTASIISGGVVIAAAVGQIFGGLIPKWGSFRVRGLLLQCSLCSLVGAALSAVLLIRCEMASIAGITVPYSVNSSDTLSLDDVCNIHCSCTSRSYEPVCDTVSGIEYFSPCHAGCTSIIDTVDELKIYSGCACVSDIPNQLMNNSQSEVEDGICQTGCNKLAIFMPLFLVIVLATFVSDTAGHAVVMRCVADKSRSFAYGLQSALVRFLGNVPGPILLGTIFDQSCMIWQDDCDSRGACWIYDNTALSWRLFLVILIVNVTSCFLFFLSVAIYKPPKATDSADISMAVTSSNDNNVRSSRVTTSNNIDNNVHSNYAFSDEGN